MQPKNVEKTSFSTAEVAEILGISRVAVFKKIQKGYLYAQKVGRNYVIAKQDLQSYQGSVVSDQQKNEIETVVKRVVKEYKPALKKLAEE